ncbi:MAG: hypothetical protein R3E95_08745 [Thiolinea sp.]
MVVPKIQEELDEVCAAVEGDEGFARIGEEVGDVLDGASNLQARQLGVDAETFCGWPITSLNGAFWLWNVIRRLRESAWSLPDRKP